MIQAGGLQCTGSKRTANTNGKMITYQQAQLSVLRVVVLDDTYGCVQHLKDLQKEDLGIEDASAPSKPQQLQVRLSVFPYKLQPITFSTQMSWGLASAYYVEMYENNLKT